MTLRTHMNSTKWAAIAGLALSVVTTMVSACSGGGDSSTGDGGTDGTIAPDSSPNAPDFSLTLSPTSVIVDPGGAVVPVTLSVTRNNGFAEAINFTLTSAPAGVSGTGTMEGTATTATFNVSALSVATNGQVATATVSALSGTTNITHTASLFIRVGHVLLIADSNTTWTVPQDVTKVTLIGWGAGGGGCSPGVGTGGAGGYAQADFQLNPNTTYTILVGTGGAKCVLQGGAGGGAYTGIANINDGGADAMPYLLIAGGGGGGTSQWAGGGGSGSDGGAGGNASNNGGTETQGGQALGAHFSGGGAAQWFCSTDIAAGGVPGGGAGCYGNTYGGFGGGGAGYFGGGICTSNAGCGGGGGSGFVDSSGTNVLAAIGTGPTPPQTTSAFYQTGLAVGGATGGTLQNPNAENGGNGRVVIVIPP